MPQSPKHSTRVLMTGLAATLWLIIALIGYYYTHKPFETQWLISLLIALWRMLVAAGILAVAGGVGTWMAPKWEELPAASRYSLQAALGAGALGILILITGMTIGVHWLTLVIILMGAGLIFRKQVREWILGWGKIDTGIGKSRLHLFLAAGIALGLFWSLISALAPPLHFDALTYHLALPHLYLLQGNLHYTPDSMFWGMPQQTEMLFTAAMALGGEEASTTLGLGLGLLTLAGIFGVMQNKFNTTTAWVTIACLFGGSSLVLSLEAGYTEWPIMLYGSGTLIMLDTWRNSHQKRDLLFAAAFAGLALGTKYTAGLLLVIGMIIIAWDGLPKKGKSFIGDMFYFGAIASLLASPWWLRNLLAVGNPFYPLLFPSGAMSQFRLDYYSGTPWGTWVDMLFLPWQATVWGIEGKVGFSWTIGPLLLGFSALSWIRLGEKTREQKLLFSTSLISTLAGFVMWALVSRWNGLLVQTRLFVAFFPAWAFLAGMGYHAMSDLKATGVRFGRIATAILILVFTFNLIELEQDFNRRNPLAVLTGRMSPSEYRTHNLGNYEAAMLAIKDLRGNPRVLMLWETRSLACLPVCDPDEVIDRWYDDSLKYQNADDILQAWKSQGFTHILLNVSGYEYVRNSDMRITSENWNKLDTLFGKLPIPEIIAPSYLLYNLDFQK